MLLDLPSLIDDTITMQSLLTEIRNCQICTAHLPLGAHPVVQAHSCASLMIIGQAPGSKVHASGIPWDDPSGDRLRGWLGVDKNTFYGDRIALLPMGFCYPGKGKSGDLPPRAECALAWHDKLFAEMPNVSLTLLVGTYAQNAYLSNRKCTLTETVANYDEYLPKYLPLPHPSPRNNIWLKKNPWFEKNVLPSLTHRINQLRLVQ